jgi:hypothetical protein
MTPATRSMEGSGLLSGSCTQDTTGHHLRPKNLDMTSSLQWKMAGEPSTPYQIRSHHSWLKRRGANLKRTKPECNLNECFPLPRIPWASRISPPISLVHLIPLPRDTPRLLTVVPGVFTTEQTPPEPRPQEAAAFNAWQDRTWPQASTPT